MCPKRFDRPALDFLSREEIQALLDAPDTSKPSGHRDAVMLAVLYNTGARVSEAIGLRIADVLPDRECAVHLHGNRRKERVVPGWKNTAAQLRGWLTRIDPSPQAPVFPNRAGKPLSRSGVEHRLRVTVESASQRCPVSRHVTSRRTHCGTQRRCACFKLAWTSLSSLCGSDTRTRPPRTCTSKPTSR
ncbi:MAG: tyrosine-type recombinase/integrase [Egibacteraceae bacterium]